MARTVPDHVDVTRGMAAVRLRIAVNSAYDHDHRETILEAIEEDDAVAAAIRHRVASKLARSLTAGEGDAPVPSRSR